MFEFVHILVRFSLHMLYMYVNVNDTFPHFTARHQQDYGKQPGAHRNPASSLDLRTVSVSEAIHQHCQAGKKGVGLGEQEDKILCLDK